MPPPDTYHPLKLLEDLLETYSIKKLAESLNVATGTVVRWQQLKDVPSNYCFDLLRLAGKKIDYSLYTAKEKDQFFTPLDTARHCFEVFKRVFAKYNQNGQHTTQHTHTIEDYHFIEPSAGSGSFLKILPDHLDVTAIDIEPGSPGIIEADYLSWAPNHSPALKYIVFGNPPFGLRGQLALKFINHSAKFADYVAFILPQLFESDGKGVPRKRVHGFNLLHSEKLSRAHFHDPQGSLIPVNCIFQVWSREHQNPEYTIKPVDTSVIQIYSLSDGGTPSTTRNKKMFNCCDVYLPSTCFGAAVMKPYTSFDLLPRRKGYGVVFHQDKKDNLEKFHKIDWSKVAFLSTNGAYNIRTSQISAMFH